MNSLALYELVGQYKSLEHLASAEELPAEFIRDTIDGLTGQIQEKATNVQMFIANLDSAAEAIRVRAREMEARADRLSSRAESLRQYLLLNMQSCGITKIESPWFTLAVRDNPVRVVIDDQSQIPKDYWRQPPVPPPVVDKQAIAAAFKAGEQVPGCHTERSQRLEVKP